MAAWQRLQLGDALEKIEGGGTPSKKNASFWHGSIPWASVKDIVTHNPADTIDHISEEGLRNSSSKLIPAGTLVTPTRMALGYAVFFDVDVAINQDLKALYPKKSINKKYLYYWFQKNKQKIDRLGNGSTVTGIQLSELRALHFKLPEKPEQERIVEVLEVWDSYLELLDKKIALKEQLKKGLMQQLLTGKNRLPGFTGKWTDTRLSKVCQINPNNTFIPETFMYIDLESVTKGSLSKIPERIHLKSAPSRAQRILKKEDILFQTVRPYQKNNYYFNLPGDYVASTGYAQLRGKGSSRFLYHFVHGERFVRQVLRMCTGSNYPAITSSDLGKIKISYPTEQEQIAIEQVLTTAEDEINRFRSIRKIVGQQKKYLLKNLISGEIRVTEHSEQKVTIHA